MRFSTSHTTLTFSSNAEMPFHQYSRLFTSGLLSEPSSSSGTPVSRGYDHFLEPVYIESPKPADSRTWSFLELADSLTSPDSWQPLGRRTPSVATSPTAIRKPEPVRVHKSVLGPTSLNAPVPSPTDSLAHLSIISTGQSFLITEPPLPDSPTLDRRPSEKTVASRSISFTSPSVKSETKQMNRLVALACLEGRGPSPTRPPRGDHSNFMSMSDDEDEDDSLPSSSRPSADREASQRLSTITASSVSVLAVLSSGMREVEPLSSDLLVPQSLQQSKIVPVRKRHRSRTMESWFPPLANFIDLKNEEDPPNWRSFIEFSTTAA
ncbi:hypothetical protein BDM02DRAFT_3122877 [Thelephora ganbajun]|uniref:Uncharacterized protein n=1 Tax=Thelephora ganbajun TaxID=370292 RepID=A0ACB6Z2T3_THEGA|nr:hypothetical protein BDM02DRAFT_3122877 [Thelephora ganbajun]